MYVSFSPAAVRNAADHCQELIDLDRAPSLIPAPIGKGRHIGAELIGEADDRALLEESDDGDALPEALSGAASWKFDLTGVFHLRSSFD